MEKRQLEIVDQLEQNESMKGGQAFELNRELATIQERLSGVMEEWERLSSSLPVIAEEKSVTYTSTYTPASL